MVQLFAQIKQSDGSKFVPTTLENCIFGIQRGSKTRFYFEINAVTGKVFNATKAYFLVLSKTEYTKFSPKLKIHKFQTFSMRRIFVKYMLAMHYQHVIRRDC